jgi:hypothetical protein
MGTVVLCDKLTEKLELGFQGQTFPPERHTAWCIPFLYLNINVAALPGLLVHTVSLS